MKADLTEKLKPKRIDFKWENKGYMRSIQLIKKHLVLQQPNFGLLNTEKRESFMIDEANPYGTRKGSVLKQKNLIQGLPGHGHSRTAQLFNIESFGKPSANETYQSSSYASSADGDIEDVVTRMKIEMNLEEQIEFHKKRIAKQTKRVQVEADLGSKQEQNPENLITLENAFIKLSFDPLLPKDQRLLSKFEYALEKLVRKVKFNEYSQKELTQRNIDKRHRAFVDLMARFS